MKNNNNTAISVLTFIGALTVFGISFFPQTSGQDFNFLLPFSEKQRAFAALMMKPAVQTIFEGDRTGLFLAGLAINPMFPGFKREFGITEEQATLFQETMQTAMRDIASIPENAEMFNVFRAVEQRLDEDIDYILTEEEAAEVAGAFQGIFEVFDSAAATAFSAEQMQKMDGMMFSLMGGLESPFLQEKHLEALELTADQKEQFMAIGGEMKQEWYKIFFDDFSTEIEKMLKTGKMSLKEIEAAGQKFKEMSESIKNRRSAILTEAQLAKVAELSKPPRFLTASPLGMMMPQWVPGPQSWKPGDPLPGGSAPVPADAPRRPFPRTE